MSMKTNAVYTAAFVVACENIATDVWELVIKADCATPIAGQFFMLRSRPSAVLLGRPISVYHSALADKSAQSVQTGQSCSVHIHFLILQKGQGTAELCALRKGDALDILGPVGNVFAPPKNGAVAIIGGGIGVAPVAGFASSLPAKSYDFYASFKSGSYGLDRLESANLFISTDDGSCGTKGMLPCVFSAEIIRERGYKTVYACGPHPMLAYVQKVCGELGVQCFLSLESRMACGVGACLGCTVATKEGNKRCCKDGPVFDGAVLEF